MTKIIEIHSFVEPNKRYKILMPFQANLLILSKRPNKYNGYLHNTTHFCLRKNYTAIGGSWTRSGWKWCHYYSEIPQTELVKVEQELNIKFNSMTISLPADIVCRTKSKPFGSNGIRFNSLKKDNSPLGVSSFVIPWYELKNIRFEEL